MNNKKDQTGSRRLHSLCGACGTRVLFHSGDNNAVVGVQPPGIRFTMFTTLCPNSSQRQNRNCVGLQKSLDPISCSNASDGTEWIIQQLHYLIESLHNV